MTTTETTTSPALDVQEIVDGYFRCWNTTDDAERASAVEAVWAPEARSVDPVADVAGHEQLCDMFAGFHDTYPGHSFRQRGGIDEHHRILRWGWEMLDPAGEVVLAGIDAALIDDSGRIGYLVGFFGVDVPES